MKREIRGPGSENHCLGDRFNAFNMGKLSGSRIGAHC